MLQLTEKRNKAEAASISARCRLLSLVPCLQLCQAYRNAEKKQTVVVLSQRPKLTMEDTFRAIIPDAARYGTKFVFRQGNPLVPDALRRVAAPAASSLIVVGDSSRYVLLVC